MPRLPARFAMIAIVSLSACRPASAPPPSSTTDPSAAAMAQASTVPPPARDDGRLPLTAVPQHYSVALSIDPYRPRFTGRATIDVELPQATSFVVLHGRGLAVSRAVARVGNLEVAATVSLRSAVGAVVPDELVLDFARALPAGLAVLDLAYDAPFASDLAGLYRVEEQGRWYAYTQFESTDARRAFPCFDEPAFKTPYDVTIAAPPGLVTLANAPETSQRAAGDGSVTHTFATSRPLPSYLVAFAVGDFDIVEGQKDPFPIRLIATKGRGHLAGQALDVAAALIAKLGEYFDMPYPYDKLDLVAVPDFAAGAMENPGLVTFRDALLLVDPSRATASTRRAQAEVIAHEFAHQWFGDLVTMRWWNDVWLNEGFATWAEAKIVDAWRPTFGATAAQIAGLEHVMDTDALRSARAVREPVRSTGEIMEAFDGITYQKGAAVLRMVENYMGPDVFQRGVQRYVHENAWKSAGADDLFKALDYVSAQKVDELASGFLDHPGVPQVLANWRCDGGAGKLELRQSQWRPLGEGGEDAPGARQAWTLPVCIRADGQKTTSCFTVGPEPITRTLHGCPAWVYPNAAQAGYYRFLVERGQLLALAHGAHGLEPTERLGIVSNAWAGVRQGAIAPSVLLDLLPIFDGESNRFVVDEVIDVLHGIDHALVEDAARPAFRKYVRARLAARKKTLGWWPPNGKPEADDDRALQRRSVLWALGEDAQDDATLAEAEKYALGWLRDHENVSADTAAVAVPLASIRAGAGRLQELRDAARSADTPEDRIIALRAMGLFDDPAVLRQAFDLALGTELKLSEWRYLFGSAMGHPPARAVLLAWEKENWQKLLARAPNSLGRATVGIAGAMCTAAERDDARAFFETAANGMEGAKRPLDEALESAELCVALRDHGAADVAQYLEAGARHTVAR